MIDSKYVTLVFKAETVQQKIAAGAIAMHDQCIGWMLDDALLKLDLIEKALQEKDLENAQKYFDAVDVSIYKNELEK